MKLEMAVHSLKDIDRLYCLCGNKSMEDAAVYSHSMKEWKRTSSV